MSSRYAGYATLATSMPAPHVLHVELAREDKRNAISTELWMEIGKLFTEVASDDDVRCILLSGRGPLFSAGIEIQPGGSTFTGGAGAARPRLDPARLGVQSRVGAHSWAAAWSSLERCGKVVMACVHGGCWGAALELVAAADIRWCTKDAYFVAKEIDFAVVADLGGLQRLPKLLGNQSLVRELVFSGRRLPAAEAATAGLVSRVCLDKEALLREGLGMATEIASKSPVATFGTKTVLNYSRDHSVEEGLEYGITWNMAAMQNGDLARAGLALASKQPPSFPSVAGREAPQGEVSKL
uniref:Dienoyl coA isomerase n=1 Tax=Gambierdiscus polynesiensis TaxID=439318 RepID=A0A6M5KDQ4_9DINO|nr:dienoyl coA isomerase [Gambierdiscus polynesiensis]